MSRKSHFWLVMVSLLVAASVLLSACGGGQAPTSAVEPTTAAGEPPASAGQPTAASAGEAQATEPAAPAAGEPQRGGKLVIAVNTEPPTLDPHKATGDLGLVYLGAALIGKDADNNYVPWLAESFELSDDGKTWTFKLRDGVTFHDGTPLKASDFVYTYTRAMDPTIASPVAGQMLTAVESVEAPDDSTVVITLKEPMAPFMDNLAAAGFLTPLSQAWVEKYGDDFGRNPNSVGPYKLKEWVTGDHLTFERNEDYAWQPAYAKNQGAFYFDEIEYRILPEVATMVAGFEAGELDYAYGIEPQYVQRIEETGNYTMLNTYLQGGYPVVNINVSKPPFDDINVRKAFALAIDRQAIIDVIQKGNARIQYGPISPSTIGYDPIVEEIGYGYDVEQAKSLLAEAGYSDSDGDGIVEKDGQPLQLTLPIVNEWVKEAEMLKEQFKAIGVEIELQQGEFSAVVGDIVSGNFEISLMGYQWPNYDIMYLIFHSSQEGTLNLNHVNDPELDEMLENMRSETDMTKQQEWVSKAQQRIVEQAYQISLYNPKTFYPLNKRVQGAYLSEKNNNLYLEDAWIQE